MRKNDAQVCLKLSGPLRTALEDWAAAESRSLSSLIRRQLVELTAHRILSREAAAKANAGAAR
jgi:hypothetical protein